MAVLVAAIDEQLQLLVADAHVLAVEQSTRQLTLSLTPHMPLNRAQQRQLTDSLRGMAASIRWATATTLQIGLPLTMPLDAPGTPCLPILRQRRTTLWWSLASIRHLVLVGDAVPALNAILQSLSAIAEHQPITFALHDPEGELQMHTLPGLTPMPDALAAARLHALRAAWGTHQHQPASLEPPLILVVVAPDALAWRDLMPLLQDTSQAVHILLLLSAGETSDEARDACHQVPVLEVGGLAVALPESHRPPGIGEPRAGAAQAWRPDHLVWRGIPIKPGTV